MSSLVGLHGVCTWFPDHGPAPVAAADLEAFTALPPAGKVFSFVGTDGPWLLAEYGSRSYRVKPSAFTEVSAPAFTVGQRVDGAAGIAEVAHVEWHFVEQRPIYLLRFNGKLTSRRYGEAELSAATNDSRPLRLILASASPARRQALLDAGLSPEVKVSAVDEDAFSAVDVVGLVNQLARAKAEKVFAELEGDDDVLVVACDSLLELGGEAMGKPSDAQQAIQRWRQMRGSTGQLHTGHRVIARIGGSVDTASAVATTEVMFANIDDAEIEAYVSTGEPLQVAGAFTIDGLGGAYVTGVCGDPHNVVGISLPLLRRLFVELGVPWHSLWRAPGRES